ncbi:MAG: ABC transporter substrate-binding protein, partial [Actinomycetota bacterium]|nr:ABC transporter substrate-binding protein [Actinomycetota bacterium]
GGDKGSLTIGAMNFSENLILADIYKGALEDAGYKATVRANLGSREVVAPALERNEIQLYPGYAATDLEFYNNAANQASPDVTATVNQLRSVLQAKGLTALEPSPAVDTNAFAVTKATADQFKLTKLSDLQPVAGQMVLGGPPECPSRPFCQEGLERVYGLNFKEFKPVGLGPVADTALEKGDVDITTVLSTDGLARAKGFVILQDDKNLQNADNVIPIARVSAATPEVVEVLNRVSAELSTEELAELNRKVDEDKEDADAVAQEWLEEHGLGQG